MTQFNSSISYGRVKFPNSSKWSNKAKNEGYRTIIIGDCEWFAEDLIEVLENPRLLPNMNVSAEVVAYNADRAETKLHQVDGTYTPTTSITNCTPYAKWVPGDQAGDGDNGIVAETNPNIPANTLLVELIRENGDWVDSTH